MTTLAAAAASGPIALRERRTLWLFAAIQFTLILDFMLLMPLGPELMAQLGLDTRGFGALVGCYSISSAVCGFTGALWLHRVQRGRLLVALYLLFTLATAGCALAIGPGSLMLARIVAGGAAGLLWAGVLAVIIDLVPAERRGSAIGLVMSAYAVAAVLGVPLGLFTAARFGWRAPFGLLAGLSLCLCGLLQRVLSSLPAAPSGAPPTDAQGSSTQSPRDSLLGSLRDLLQPVFITGWCVSFCVVCAGFLLIPYLGTFISNNLGLSTSQLGWVYLIAGSSTFVSSRFVGWLVDNKGPVVCLLGLLLGTLVPHFLLTHLTHATFVQLALIFTLFMTLTSGRMIATITLISDPVPPHLRARFLAVNTATTDVASAVASAVGGLMLGSNARGELVGFGRVGLLACSVSLFTLAVVALHLRSRQRAPSALPLGGEA